MRGFVPGVNTVFRDYTGRFRVGGETQVAALFGLRTRSLKLKYRRTGDPIPLASRPTVIRSTSAFLSASCPTTYAVVSRPKWKRYATRGDSSFARAPVTVWNASQGLRAVTDRGRSSGKR